MSTPDHLLMSTWIINKPILTYGQLCTLLAKATSIVNNRPVRVRNLVGGLDLGPGGEGPTLHGLDFGVGAMKAGVPVLLSIL